MKMTERPVASDLYDPLVYALGRLSKFRPYVGISRGVVRDKVLRLVGIDPQHSPWPLKSASTKKRDGLYRVIHFAWYHQTRRHRIDPLCARGLARNNHVHGWALSLHGVEKAKRLRKRYDKAWDERFGT